MAKRTQIETGMEQRSSSDTMKNPSLDYDVDVKRNDQVDATLGIDPLPPQEDKAFSDANARNTNTDRRRPEEKLPTDPLDPDRDRFTPPQKR